jgi:hypothetical protein
MNLPQQDQPQFYTCIPNHILCDLEMTAVQYRVFSMMVAARRRGTWTVQISQAALAKAAGVTEETVRGTIQYCVEKGYITRERDCSLPGRPYTIKLNYQLRRAAAASTSKDAPDPLSSMHYFPKQEGVNTMHYYPKQEGVNTPGFPKQEGVSFPKREGVNPTVVEPARDEFQIEFERTNERESSSFGSSENGTATAPLPQPPMDEHEPPSREGVLATLAQNAAKIWSHEENLHGRIKALAVNNSVELVKLAIEYAGLKHADGFGFVVHMINIWHHAGYDVEDIRAEVAAARLKPERELKQQNLNPGLPTQPDRAPTADEVAEAIEGVESWTGPTRFNPALSILRRWINYEYFKIEALPEHIQTLLAPPPAAPAKPPKPAKRPPPPKPKPPKPAAKRTPPPPPPSLQGGAA